MLLKQVNLSIVCTLNAVPGGLIAVPKGRILPNNQQQKQLL